MRLGRVVGAVAGLALSAGARSAAAEGPVFTDQGWYQLEGADPSPGERPGELTVVPATPVVAKVAPAAPEPRVAEPVVTAQPEPCLDARGALARRLLALRGWSLSDQDVSDEALGRLGLMPVSLNAQALPWVPAASWDPDATLLAGALPLPLGALSFDWEAQADAAELLRCESR